MSLSRRSFLTVAFATAACATATPSLLWADDADPAQAFIQGLSTKALEKASDRQLSEKDRRDGFRELLRGAFDLPDIARFVLGIYWTQATPEQQQEFQQLFEDFTVLTWARRFREYHGEKFETLGSVRDPKGWQVDSRFNRLQGPPVQILWQVREINGALKVSDVMVEGVSMRVTQRNDYSGALRGNGGKMDAFLSSLRTKVDQLRSSAE